MRLIQMYVYIRTLIYVFQTFVFIDVDRRNRSGIRYQNYMAAVCATTAQLPTILGYPIGSPRKCTSRNRVRLLCVIR